MGLPTAPPSSGAPEGRKKTREPHHPRPTLTRGHSEQSPVPDGTGGAKNRGIFLDEYGDASPALRDQHDTLAVRASLLCPPSFRGPMFFPAQESASPPSFRGLML